MTEELDTTLDLPHAPEAEAAALCLMIEYPKRFIGFAHEAQISEDYFHSAGNRALWTMIGSRISAGKFVDPTSLREAIADEKPKGLTIANFSDVLLTEFDPAAWHSYVDTLRDRYARRAAIMAGKSVKDENLDGQAAVAALSRAVEAARSALAGTSAVMDAKTSVSAFIDALTERFHSGDIPGLSTGIDCLDEMTGGMRKGELWVIGAKTSRGKSVLMLQIAAAVLQAKKRVAVFSLEMSADEIVGRLISCGGRIPINQILNPRSVSKYYQDQIATKAKELSTTGLLICDKADLSIETISGHCQRLSDTGGLDLVIIDYLQLVSSPRIKGQNREQEVATISRGCKQLAKRLKCPVITATQLNEQGQARESRAIEQDADAVFFIVGDGENEKLIAWKSRNGKRNEELSSRLDGLHQKFSFSKTN